MAGKLYLIKCITQIINIIAHKFSLNSPSNHSKCCKCRVNSLSINPYLPKWVKILLSEHLNWGTIASFILTHVKNVFPERYSHIASSQTVKFCAVFICRRKTQNAHRKSHIQGGECIFDRGTLHPQSSSVTHSSIIYFFSRSCT